MSRFESLCAAGGVRRSVVCRTAQLATIFELVAVGLGVSIVPAMAARAGRSRAIRAVPLAGIAGSAEPDGHAGAGSGPAPWREIACIRRRDRSLSRGGARLTALLRHRLAEASP
ncbi:MAG: LysR family transcriptional regulator substrate-binding protein [Phycisphaeraceae bacterium]|nr:LysR family transcriptional regulator substrate-binding protein [Phycisphaeraceae bacterium]